MHSYRDRKEFDHLTRQLAARYLDAAATPDELPPADEATLRAVVELHEARLRREVKALLRDGLLL